jgi:(1->4)-alpha-D-glucan 1-alpha-D-glucosylmutase
MIPRATYRLQFHEDFTFADAEAIVPYLRDLGISHVYASPLAQARAGSTHGYDALDPTRISRELGGEEGLRSLVVALRAAAMGLILDIVPNHVAASPANPWWADMLRLGRASPYATFFDIDWDRHDGCILLPVLGDPLETVIEQGQVEIVQEGGEPMLRLYGEDDYPLAPGSIVADDLTATLAAQHYRLAWWKLGHDELNWRRFFSISELAGLRIEEETVFEAVHALPLRLYRERLIDGLRIDHVDGLADPAAYLTRLRERLDALDQERGASTDRGPAWLVVEKILGPGERLPADWPVDGTTGYEFMDQVSQLLHAPAAERVLGGHWAVLSGRTATFEAEELLARRQMLHWEFSAQLEACVDALVALAAHTPETALHSRAAWARAVETVLVLFPVYRTYGTGEASAEADAAARAQVDARLDLEAPPGEAELARTILAWLAGEGPAAEHAGEFVPRFQQLSAPIAAKAVEDTAFYRYGRLLSRNDVGFDANRFAATAEEFHAWQAERAQNWPHSMLTTATHDHKRGEDVRARLYAVSELAREWTDASSDWMERLPGTAEIQPGDLYMLLQVVLGAWPDGVAAEDTAALADYAARLKDYAVKALREAKLRSSWAAPDEAYEGAVLGALDTLLVGEAGHMVRAGMAAFRDRLAPIERVKGLVQVFLRNTCPGVPDLYQGAELPDRSLVDPDNRRPVDYGLRARLLAESGSEKQRLLRDLLHLRADHPAAFAGGYEAVALSGAGAGGLIAFTRGDGAERLLMVAAIRPREDGGEPDFAAADQWNDVALSGTVELQLGALVARGDNLLAGGLPCAAWLVPA